MSNFPQNVPATIIPALRYKDAPGAIEWLCRALGFEKHLVFPNPDGTVGHAQLKFGNGMIMLSSITESEFGKLMIQPRETGGRNTQTPYLIVNDADAVYAAAKAAQAEIVMEIADQDYGVGLSAVRIRKDTFGTSGPITPGPKTEAKLR